MSRFRTVPRVLRQLRGNRGLLRVGLFARVVQRREQAVQERVKTACRFAQQGEHAEIGRGLPGDRDQMTKHASSRVRKTTRIRLRPNG